MANKSTVAGDLRRFATFVKGLTEAADTLDQMQSLEETALATEQRVTAAAADLAFKQAEINKTATEYINAIEAMTKGGGDLGMILEDSKEELSALVED